MIAWEDARDKAILQQRRPAFGMQTRASSAREPIHPDPCALLGAVASGGPGWMKGIGWARQAKPPG